MLAEPLAVRCTQRPVGQREQYLLAHDILEHKPALVIIPDLGLFFRDCALAGVGIGIGGAEEEVELTLEALGDGIEAAGTEQREVAGVGGAQADIFNDLFVAAVLKDEFGAAVEGEGAGLKDVRVVVNGTGGEAGVDLERFPGDISWGDDHGASSIFSWGGGEEEADAGEAARAGGEAGIAVLVRDPAEGEEGDGAGGVDGGGEGLEAEGGGDELAG